MTRMPSISALHRGRSDKSSGAPGVGVIKPPDSQQCPTRTTDLTLTRHQCLQLFPEPGRTVMGCTAPYRDGQSTSVIPASSFKKRCGRTHPSSRPCLGPCSPTHPPGRQGSPLLSFQLQFASFCFGKLLKGLGHLLTDFLQVCGWFAHQVNSARYNAARSRPRTHLTPVPLSCFVPHCCAGYLFGLLLFCLAAALLPHAQSTYVGSMLLDTCCWLVATEFTIFLQ